MRESEERKSEVKMLRVRVIIGVRREKVVKECEERENDERVYNERKYEESVRREKIMIV